MLVQVCWPSVRGHRALESLPHMAFPLPAVPPMLLYG